MSRYSSFYGDIEVEVQIPNPAQIAMALGLDPTGMQEGSMQFKYGTVIEMQNVVVRLLEPDDLEKLKDTWFRTSEYTLSNQEAVATPDQVTISFGAKVTGGSDGRDTDPGEMKVVQAQTDEPSEYYRERYLAEEVMSNAVNRILNIGGNHPYNHWLVSNWPEDAATPWYDGGSVKRPSSVQVQVRGYVGVIERGPGKGDYDAEAPERPANATRTIETHFINVVADVNGDGVYDRDDDDECLEEGSSGGKGLLLNTEPDAAEAVSSGTDANVRKIIVRFSRPVTSLSALQVQVVSDSLAGFHVWRDSQKQQELSTTQGSAGYGYYTDASSDGSDLELWLSADPTAQGGTFKVFLMGPDDQAGGDSVVRYMALDEFKITVTGAGIDVDSDNNGTVDSSDDSIEEDPPGLIIVASNSDTPGEFDLVVHQYGQWGALVSPSATLYRDGTGAFRVENATGQVVMSESSTSGTLSSSDIDGTGTVTFKSRAPKTTTVPGASTLRLEIAANGHAIASDWVKVSVIRLRLTEVTFSGTGSHTVYEDGSTSTYAAPHWKDNSNPLDNSAQESGDRRYPVCFERNTTPSLACKVSLGMTVASAPTFKVKATGPDSINVPETVASLSGDTLTRPIHERSRIGTDPRILGVIARCRSAAGREVSAWGRATVSETARRAAGGGGSPHVPRSTGCSRGRQPGTAPTPRATRRHSRAHG